MNTFPMSDTGPVIELRRYTAAVGARADLARRFDDDLAPAFQQLGGMTIGHFCERERPDGVAWLRGFGSRAQCDRIARAFDARAPLAGADAGGLILTTLDPASALALPSVAGDALGIVVAHILPVRPGLLVECARVAEDRFASYHGHGVIEAGILVTPDEHRTFPGRAFPGRAFPGRAFPAEADPVRAFHGRNDPGRAFPGEIYRGTAVAGAVLVWLGVVRDEAALAELRPALDDAAAALAAAGLLAAPGEVLVLDPCKRSRLRWVGAASVTAPARATAMAAA